MDNYFQDSQGPRDLSCGLKGWFGSLVSLTRPDIAGIVPDCASDGSTPCLPQVCYIQSTVKPWTIGRNVCSREPERGMRETSIPENNKCSETLQLVRCLAQPAWPPLPQQGLQTDNSRAYRQTRLLSSEPAGWLFTWTSL